MARSVKPLTVREAAAELGVGRSRIQELITLGRLPAEKIGMQWLIQPADLKPLRDRKVGRPKTKVAK